MKSLTIFYASVTISIMLSCFSGKTISTKDTDIYTRLAAGETVIIKDEVIDEVLDFERLFQDGELTYEIEGELQFINCTFKEEIKWSSKTGRILIFRDDVVFRDCIFDKSCIISDARFEGRVFVTGCMIRNSLDLQRNTFEQQARIEENEIGNDLIMQYTRSKGDLSLFGSKAGRDILMQGLSIFGKTQMGNVECNGALDLSNGDFHEVFSANYLKVGRKVLAGNSSFFGDFSMIDLETAGTVSLKKSRVFGEYSLKTKDGNIDSITDPMTIDLK